MAKAMGSMPVTALPMQMPEGSRALWTSAGLHIFNNARAWAQQAYAEEPKENESFLETLLARYYTGKLAENLAEAEFHLEDYLFKCHVFRCELEGFGGFPHRSSHPKCVASIGGMELGGKA